MFGLYFEMHLLVSFLQTILMNYHTLFISKIVKDVAKFVVCCSRDWRFKGELHYSYMCAFYVF